MSQLLPHASAQVVGELIVPGSKSETNRALVLAALADGPSTIRGALESRDSSLMLAGLSTLGAQIQTLPSSLVVTPPTHFLGGQEIDCGLAGTVMRFLPPIALLAVGPTRFFGDDHASLRPMKPILDGLRALGAGIDQDQLPFSLEPPADLVSADIEIDSSESSQFVSGLLLVAPFLPNGLVLRHRGATLPSRPHISMTVEMLRARGVDIIEPDETSWIVRPGKINAQDLVIEPDLTNAAVFLAAAAIAGGSVTVPGWPAQSLQPGTLFLDLVEQLGAEVSRTADAVTVSGTGRLSGIDVDLSTASELTPVIAALGAFADGETRIRGVGHIRGHETNRIEALVTELRKVGVSAQETADGLTITGTQQLQPALLATYADHRMAHFAALLALRVPGISVDDLTCVSKTMPDFAEDWSRLVG